MATHCDRHRAIVMRTADRTALFAALLTLGSLATACASPQPSPTVDTLVVSKAQAGGPAGGEKQRLVATVGTRSRFSVGRQVTYRDKVAVKVHRLGHGVEKGAGPGVFPKRRYLAVTLTLANGSAAAIDVNRVLVRVRYGPAGRAAAPVYQDSAQRDFSGTVLPGRSATAHYAFAVPRGAGPVVLTVAFDGIHAPATLTGGES